MIGNPLRRTDRVTEALFRRGGVDPKQRTEMTTTTIDPARLLTDDMLARFDQRAATYDHDNTFFHEDWEELR